MSSQVASDGTREQRNVLGDNCLGGKLEKVVQNELKKAHNLRPQVFQTDRRDVNAI